MSGIHPRFPSLVEMARKIRYVPDGLLVEVTCRTLHGRYLFKPSRGFRELFVGILARAQELYPLKIHFAVCLSNHFHLLQRRREAAVGEARREIARPPLPFLQVTARSLACPAD